MGASLFANPRGYQAYQPRGLTEIFGEGDCFGGKARRQIVIESRNSGIFLYLGHRNVALDRLGIIRIVSVCCTLNVFRQLYVGIGIVAAVTAGSFITRISV